MFYNLCLGGGGIKLISYIGCLKYLVENNYLHFNKLKILFGVSAGSIICFLINIGYSIKELEEFAVNFHFKKLLPNINTENLLFHYGFDENIQMKKLFIILLKNKLNCNNITFKELHLKTKVHLKVGVANITNDKFEVWDYLNTPDFSVIDAITISCNIPILYKPIKFNNYYYVDGGIFNNFPIDLFNTKSKYTLQETLGICCDNKKIISFENVFQYLGKIISLLTLQNDSSKISYYQNKFNIIKIKSIDETFDFDLSAEIIKNRMDFGYNQAKLFFINKKHNKRRHSI